MHVKLKAFPAVYFTAKCKRHDCWVEVRSKTSTDRTDTHTIGWQFVAIQCQVGGEAKDSKCVDEWEMSISSSGDVKITQ